MQAERKEVLKVILCTEKIGVNSKKVKQAVSYCILKMKLLLTIFKILIKVNPDQSGVKLG